MYMYILAFNAVIYIMKKITYKQLQKHVFWNSLQILHKKPSFYHTMHLFLGFI